MNSESERIITPEESSDPSTERLKQDIEHTREDLSETVAALEERLSPSQLRAAIREEVHEVEQKVRTVLGEQMSDAKAFTAWLDSQASVAKNRKIGTQGYCMGGPLIMKTAATLPNRIGAAASFHGGGLVTANPDSPHLLAPKIKAHMYIGIAASDDATQPDAKDKLKEAFAAAKVPAEVELYVGTQHGWCMKDMPKQANGMPIYNQVDAEKAWGKLLALYKAALA